MSVSHTEHIKFYLYCKCAFVVVPVVLSNDYDNIDSVGTIRITNLFHSAKFKNLEKNRRIPDLVLVPHMKSVFCFLHFFQFLKVRRNRTGHWDFEWE